MRFRQQRIHTLFHDPVALTARQRRLIRQVPLHNLRPVYAADAECPPVFARKRVRLKICLAESMSNEVQHARINQPIGTGTGRDASAVSVASVVQIQAPRGVLVSKGSVIRTRGLTKSYGNVQALFGVDLEVKQGEVFGFLGPNGSGKTTAIRCMLDLIRPQGGTISVLGLNPQAEPEAVKARVGHLPGELHLDENLTARQVFQYFNALRSNRSNWDFVEELSDRLKLDLKTPIKNFSKGNKQKVGVVQALMHRPELLLLDEPTSGLDPLVQQEVLRMLSEAQSAGATVFFSSHIISEVQAVADRVAIIRAGKIVEVAETASLLNRPMRRVRIRFQQPHRG